MSKLNKILGSREINSAKKLASVITPNWKDKVTGGLPKEVKSGLGIASRVISNYTPYESPPQPKKLRNPYDTDPDVELVYDYFKNIKIPSLKNKMPGLDLEKLGKELLKRATGVDLDVVPVYVPNVEVTGSSVVSDVLDTAAELAKDPASGLIKTYDVLRKYDKIPDLSKLLKGKGNKDQPEQRYEMFYDKLGRDNVFNPYKKNKEVTKIGYPVFQGWCSVENIEVWSSHLWDIKIEPYNSDTIKGHAPYPPAFNGMVPVTSFEFQDEQMTPFSVEMAHGTTFMVPEGINKTRSLRLTVLDTIGSGSVWKYEGNFLTELDDEPRVRSWMEYFKEYKKAMVRDHRVIPYKNVCTAITIFTLDTNNKVMYKKTYLGIPMNLDTSYGGGAAGAQEFNIEFSLVGEL